HRADSQLQQGPPGPARDRLLPQLERAGVRQRQADGPVALRVRHDLPVLSGAPGASGLGEGGVTGWPGLLLCGTLAIGQAPAVAGGDVPGTPDGVVSAQPAPPAPHPAPDRWPLMRALQGTWYGATLDDNRLSVSGWTDLSFTASTARHDQLPMGFNFLANDFLLQQNSLRVERRVDQSATTPTVGYRWDTILPGSDYRFTIARGLLDWQLTADNGNPNLYRIDPVQFYGEAYFPQVGRGLDVKVGRFFAQFGVESIDTTQNPFLSRAYTFIYNPFTHTGLLTTLKLNDTWSVQNGLATGCDIFFAPGENLTYIGSVKWAPPSGPASALLSVIVCS